MAENLKVEYRWQFTEWEQMEILPVPVFPIIVVDDELLRDSFEIEEFLERHKLSFEEFTQRVPDDYDGALAILNIGYTHCSTGEANVLMQ